MLKRFVLTAICAALLGGSFVFAQQPPPPAPTQRPEAAPAPAPPPPPPRTIGQPVTIRIDLTITDQVGTATPTKKTMTMFAADRERASVRSENRLGQGNPSYVFNVDARPVLDQDRIHLELVIAYNPPAIPQTGGDKPDWSSDIRESMGIVVENGRPLVVSQSADPRTDRRVTVEVKATILK